MNKVFLRAASAIFRKDALSLYALLLLTALLQALDVLVAKLDLWPTLDFFLPTALVLANSVVIFSVVQSDAPVSLTDDWLCRPIPRGALLLAKGLLLVLVMYLPRVLTTLVADMLHGYPLTEALLEALLFQDWLEMLYLPIILMVAVCTANMIEGLGVMIGVFVLVFVIPTPLITPPGPEDMAVGEALNANGLRWMGLLPGVLIFILAAALCVWAAYSRRNIGLARAALAGGVVLGVLACIAPMVLLPWATTFSLQRTLYGTESAAASPAHKAILRQTRACFPALRVGDITDDSDFNRAKQRLGVHLWAEEQLQAAGNDAIAFVTHVRQRGLPDDWRVQVTYAQASYYGHDATPLLTIRPSDYIAASSNGLAGETIAHTWLLSETALRRLAEIAEPRLEIDYSVAVLSPVSAQLAIDGNRRQLPGIGYCSATRDTLNDRIDIDCFSAGRRAALISAELDGVSASRVDAMPVDFSPSLLRVLSGKRVELAVLSPGLVESSVVKVTAYYPQSFTTLRASSEGLLGNGLAACPLPSIASVTAPQVSSWNDRSPHESKAITVEPGVQLEVLDWGGRGMPVVLLPGLGATAHSYDELAPLLAAHHRVVGITRRGIGYSSRADHGYGQSRLTQDIVQVLDALGITKAVLIGHSIAGDELTTFGVRHPDRVAALVYLDAAYDRSSSKPSERYRELDASLPDRPQPLPEDFLSYAALLRYFDRMGSDHLPEGELIAAWNMGNPYLAGQIALDSRVPQAIKAGLTSPDYARLHVPALAIYATSAGPDAMLKPWHDANDTALRETLRELQAEDDAMKRRKIEQFRQGVKGARVIELPGASHWIIVSNRDDVLRAINDFLVTLPEQ